MKTREGTVVDADTLLDSLRELALEEIQAKGREDAVGDPAEIAEKIALGAVHYYLAQATPTKDMIFNPKESLSFNGNTGPYIQYMGARISSMLRKRDKGEGKAGPRHHQAGAAGRRCGVGARAPHRGLSPRRSSRRAPSTIRPSLPRTCTRSRAPSQNSTMTNRY